MEKREFIEALTELANTENVLSVSKEVNELRTQFEDYILEEERKIQVAQLIAEEKGEEVVEENWTDALKEEFYNVFSPFNDKRKALFEERKKNQESNLHKKRALIAQMRDLIDKEENIGAAFGKHKEINEKWKEIGEVSRENRSDIQQEYSRLVEEFFYNMNIYKEIKEYDFKKNFDAKTAVIEKLKALLSNDKIKEVEAEIKALQDEWEDIGPTKQELWEEIKNEYWSTVNSIYDRIRSHYDAVREKSQGNITLKKELIARTEALINQTRETEKDWENHTSKVLALQNEWKTIGFGPKKENEEVWKVFRGLCDQFFDAKSEFYKVKRSEYDKVADVKRGLIAKAHELKESDDWTNTSKAIINLQQQWKKVGNAGQKFEQKLWKEFRTACDYFFNAKTAFYEEKDKALEGNLKEKESLIEEIRNFTIPEDKKEAILQLKEFSKRFAEIGFVPAKAKDGIYKSYKEALYKHYEALDMKDAEKEKVMFEARISTMQGSGNSSELLEREKRAIRDEMQKIKHEIIQFENNLGFFANSKGSNPIKEQVEKSIQVEQEKLEALKAKLKMIPNE
ncbi:MAG TPA: DUF349 domain-containing protein [Brumimicrobium sp.]|nr:DUF349 domain-containing protein [Brumimicrobium sp.]